ncbi:MAG: universal stress protein [Candidatus Syntrophonatronum acetioxidans]|uniref:Universal stress protein n=1 Tax=Candidatus Syntrophonatronum acetioxidans TaxID=1795816 RepID=A0A424YIA1_9FIRM|nr:MAG: universal stress protein [Candidatus Syntrophonatronum acetioxidans]
MFKKILLCYDFSQPSEELFNFLDELKEFDAEEVIITHVIEEGMRAFKIHEKAEEYFAPKKKELEEKGFLVHVEIPVGFLAEEVKRLARRENVSLILLGARGKSRIKEMLLGSLASNVIRIAENPVFIEKYKKENGDYKPVCSEKFCKILCPTDFSDPSLEIFEKVKELAKMRPDKIKEVVLSHVIARGESEKEIEAYKGKALGFLERMKKDLEAFGPQVKTDLSQGMPSEVINALAEEEGTTLIIMATRGAGGIKELLLGSTAENVARRSTRPVMLFPVKP